MVSAVANGYENTVSLISFTDPASLGVDHGSLTSDILHVLFYIKYGR